MRMRLWQHTQQCMLVVMLNLAGCGNVVDADKNDEPYETNADPGELTASDGEDGEAASNDNAQARRYMDGDLEGDLDATGATVAQAFAREACALLTDDGPTAKLQPRVEIVAKGLAIPWDLAFLPNGDILVTERPGRLRLIRDGRLVRAPVLTVKIAKISAPLGSEGGLLGVVLHPQFAQNRLFYLYYTISTTNNTPINRVVRYRLSAAGTSATVDKIILDNIPAGGHHQGGRMRIGPDGLLYVGVGAYEPELAQQQDQLPGKLLRMNLDGTVPASNPTPGSLVYASGVRNTQGYDWYDEHHLLLMDHGPTGIDPGMANLWGLDELNVVRAGDNLGWPEVYGCATRPGLTEPVMAWRNALPPGGAAIYKGTAIPEWKGDFFVATLGFSPGSGRHLHRIQIDPDNPYVVRGHEVYLRNEYGRLRAVIMGPDGHLYLTTSNCDPRGTCPLRGDLVLRIVGARKGS